MRKQLVMLVVGATLAVGCGETKKAPRSYNISTERATSVSRLAMRTASMAARHSVIPKGSDTNPAHARKCPASGELNKIVITPACKPDFAGAVNCVFTEVYTCPEVAGTIKNEVKMGKDALSFTLSMTDYKEGNDALGFINYTGSVSATTTPDGKTVYSSGIAVVARSLGDTVDTIADSSSTVTVSTSATSLVFNGLSFLNTSLGIATMALNNVDFGDCAISPKSGTIDLALVGIELAQLRVDGCGDVKLVHFDEGAVVGEEKMSTEDLISAFGSSISDVTTFKGVTTNTEKSAPAIIGSAGEKVFGRAGARWCVPFISGANLLMASDVTGSAFPLAGSKFDAASIAGETKPINECLIFTPAADPATQAGHFLNLVIVDETGIGAFGDPTKNKIVFAQAGVALDGSTPYGIALAAGGFAPGLAPGKVSLTWVVRYTPGLPVYEATFNPAKFEEDLTTNNNPGNGIPDGNPDGAYCDPTTNIWGNGACVNRKLFSIVFDHFGLGLLQLPKAYWFVHTF